MVPLVTLFAAGAYRIPALWCRGAALRRVKLVSVGLLLGVFSYAGDLESYPENP